MSEPQEVFDASESPIPLSSRADVRRALAKVLRQIHKGSMEVKVGHCLVIGLGTLAKMMHEDDETELLRRLDALERRRAEATQ